MADNQKKVSEFDALIDDTQKASHDNTGENPVPKQIFTNPVSSEEYKVYKETYTEEELRDVNNITVTIPDDETPIVVLFGAPSMGKTMALLRLIRFFDEKYGTDSDAVIPERVFRPESDRHYQKMCDALKIMAYSDYSPGPTDIISFMLVKIYNQGQPICQILEAPGEHYFDGTASSEFPTYIQQIMGTTNPKIWVFFVQKDWGKNQNERDSYKRVIHQIERNDDDQIVFLFNQADRFKGALHDDEELFEKEIEKQYRGLFSPFRNTGVKKFLYGRDNYKMVCFSSGRFTKTQNQDKNKREMWIPGNDNSYCEKFWKLLDLPNK